MVLQLKLRKSRSSPGFAAGGHEKRSHQSTTSMRSHNPFTCQKRRRSPLKAAAALLFLRCVEQHGQLVSGEASTMLTAARSLRSTDQLHLRPRKHISKAGRLQTVRSRVCDPVAQMLARQCSVATLILMLQFSRRGPDRGAITSAKQPAQDKSVG